MGIVSAIGNAIGGIGGIVQAKINQRTALQNTNLTNLANKQMAEYSYSKDLEMWNRQNAYNSPEAQMERFKSAGLNPNLIYGQGSSGNATTLPRFSAPTQRFDYQPGVNLPETLSMFQDMRIKNAQVDNLKAQEENTRAQTALIGLRSLDQTAKNFYNFGNANLGETVGGGSRFNYDVGNLKGNKSLELLRSQASILNATVEDQISKIRLNNLLTGENIVKSNAQGALLNKQNMWFVANNISDIVGKAVGSFGISSLLRKAPIQNITKQFIKLPSGNSVK